MSGQALSLKNLEQRAHRLSLIVAVVFFIFSNALILIGFRGQDNNILFLGGIALAIGLMGIIVNTMIRRGKQSTQIWLVLLVVVLGIPLGTLTSRGLGWVTLVFVPISITFLAVTTLPRKQIIWAIGLGLLSGAAGWWIDANIQSVRTDFPLNELIFPVSIQAIITAIIYITSLRFSRFSLRAKLLVLFLGVALVPLLIISIINTRANRNALTQAANVALSSTAEQTGQEIDTFIQGTTESLETQAQLIIFKEALTATPDIYEILETDVLQTLQVLINENPNYLIRYDLMNREGLHIAGVPRLAQTPQPFLGLNPTLVNG